MDVLNFVDLFFAGDPGAMAMAYFVGLVVIVILVMSIPGLMRLLILPFSLVLAFFVYDLAGIEAAAIMVILGILVVIANPKPGGGYYDPVTGRKL